MAPAERAARTLAAADRVQAAVRASELTDRERVRLAAEQRRAELARMAETLPEHAPSGEPEPGSFQPSAP